MAFGILKFGTKVGIFGGAIYYSKQLGVWSNSERTTQLLLEGINYVKPYIKDVPVPVETTRVPSMAELVSSSKSSWNNGVLATSTFLSNLPSNAVVWSKSAMDFINQQLQPPANTPKN
ncbi:MICOS complex subunit MIC13 homolog QIL1 [Nilaparvata lugens]|uniref:MICOS complex subunit MIC13 homolog QIL1 n=1 Tax=Nilaparvata lugens TaxID=108931 RepID=UPI00193E448D|nr:MICOS complex subunit MIC13 homolog QIL1 [Nilaparvata lugens]